VIKPNVELVKDHSTLGPGASVFKSWRLFLWIAFVCSLLTCIAFYVAWRANPEVLSNPRRVIRQNGFALPYLIRLSILLMVVFPVGWWIRRSPRRSAAVVKSFCNVPLWRGHFAKDDLEARVRRRALSTQLAIFGTVFMMMFGSFWLINCAFLFM
jgi:hypothetical protein